MIHPDVHQAANNIRPGVVFSCNGEDSDQLVVLLDGEPDPDQSAVPSEAEIQAEISAYSLAVTKSRALIAINTMRDAKKVLPILTEGEQVNAGTLSSGAMANELFAYDGKSMEVVSVTRTGNVASFVFAKNHHLDTGQTFTSAGAGQSEYNDDFIATVTGKKTLDVTVAGSPASPATGTITALTSDYPWIDHLNNDVFWSASKFKSVHRDTTKYERDCVRHGRSLKNDVLTSATVAEIEAIDITSGWPDTGL